LSDIRTQAPVGDGEFFRPGEHPGELDSAPRLRRSLGPWQMAAYGAGSMLGAGIYGLIGVVAGQMGSAVWLAFLVSLVAALLTGLSYASLGSRYPRAAGAAYITHRAYGSGMLTHLVGLAIACSALTSMAAGSRVIGENLQRLPGLAEWPVPILACFFLVLVALLIYRGIRESMWVNITATAIEAGGLFLVLAVGMRYWGSVDLFDVPPPPSGARVEGIPLILMVQGAILTFYAFLGFEDTLNVAEEVKNPRRNVPLGLVMAMTLSAILYIGVAITAVSVVPWQELANAGAPLAEVMARAAPWFPTSAFVIITIIAVGNTALINYITCSRLLYGMARDKRLPEPLSRVHARRHTPHVAVFVILAFLIVLVVIGNIGQLAEATVLLMLLVFGIVCSALVGLKLTPGEAKGGFEVPVFVPALGTMVCLSLFMVRVMSGNWVAPTIAGVLLLITGALYFILRPEREEDEAAESQAR
jgi:amino acid transporter